MPDITMCLNQDCPMRNTCWRYLAQPSDYQSVSIYTPESDGTCDHFLPVVSMDERRFITTGSRSGWVGKQND